MKHQRVTRSRTGVGLVEILVAVTLMGIIGVSILRTFTSQVRFADIQSKRISARGVSRAPVNLFMSEVRMVETEGGVVAASATSITLRVPIAMGIVCGSAGLASVVSLMPVDSAVIASAVPSGHAYRQTDGTYAYSDAAVTMVAGASGICNGASITTVTGGRTVLLTPALDVAAAVGQPAFIYQRIRYDFGPSTSIPGRIGLWRTLVTSGATEELAAPFAASARFRFFRNNNDTSDVVVPPLDEVRGLELSLVGASERPRYGRVAPETSRYQTAVFFLNRIN